MAACLLVTDAGYSVAADTAPNSCAGYVLQASAEYQASNPFSTLDYSLAMSLLGFELGIFITAYACGFICRKLGR